MPDYNLPASHTLFLTQTFQIQESDTSRIPSAYSAEPAAAF